MRAVMNLNEEVVERKWQRNLATVSCVGSRDGKRDKIAKKEGKGEGEGKGGRKEREKQLEKARRLVETGATC